MTEVDIDKANEDFGRGFKDGKEKLNKITECGEMSMCLAVGYLTASLLTLHLNASPKEVHSLILFASDVSLGMYKDIIENNATRDWPIAVANKENENG